MAFWPKPQGAGAIRSGPFYLLCTHHTSHVPAVLPSAWPEPPNTRRPTHSPCRDYPGRRVFMARTPPNPADQQLIQLTTDHGVAVSARQLERWRAQPRPLLSAPPRPSLDALLTVAPPQPAPQWSISWCGSASTAARRRPPLPHARRVHGRTPRPGSDRPRGVGLASRPVRNNSEQASLEPRTIVGLQPEETNGQHPAAIETSPSSLTPFGWSHLLFCRNIKFHIRASRTKQAIPFYSN